MNTQIAECILGVPFGYEPNKGIKKLLEEFRDMVNFCIDYAYERRITSYAKLRKDVYGKWKQGWSYSTHFCHSACKIALAILKTCRRKHKEGKPEARNSSSNSTRCYTSFMGKASGFPSNLGNSSS